MSNHPLAEVPDPFEVPAAKIHEAAKRVVGPDDEFRKAVIASCKQTVNAVDKVEEDDLAVDFQLNAHTVTELHNARALAEAILSHLGETP